MGDRDGNETASVSATSSDEESFTHPIPPDNCDWKRPTLLYVTRGVNLYMRVDVFKEVKKVLFEFGGNAALDRFKSGVVGRLIDVRRNHSASNALHHLLARQLRGSDIPCDESWFQVGGRTLRFRATEYALVTGHHFGNFTFDPYAIHTVPPNSIFYRFFNGASTKVSVLRKRFNEKRLGNDVEDYLKAANLLVYYLFLLCRDNPVIEDWAWTLVEDFEIWDAFSWGSYTFGALCYYIDTVAMLPDQAEKDYHFYGPIWALQIWSYEAVPSLGSYCGFRESEEILPRCLRWSTRQMKIDFTSFLDNKRLEVYPELEPTESELDEYYMMSFDNGDQFDVRFKAPVRIASKNHPTVQKTKKKTMGKLKSMASKMITAEAARPSSKRPRQSTPPLTTAERGQRDRVCCVHERPCPDHEEGTSRGGDIEDRLKAILNDESDTGFLARLTRKMSQFFVLRRFRSPPQHSIGSHRMSLDRHDEVLPRPSQSRSHHSRHDEVLPRPSQSRSHHSRHDEVLPRPSQSRSHHSRHDEVLPRPSQSHSHHSLYQEDPSRLSQQFTTDEATSSQLQHDLFTHIFQPVQPVQHFSIDGASYQTYIPPEACDLHSPQRGHEVHTPEHSQSAYCDDPDDYEEDEDEDEETGDKSLGPRERRPSATVRTPFQGEGPSGPEILRRQYREFRRSGPGAIVVVIETEAALNKKFFDVVEDVDLDFTQAIIDQYVLSTRTRLRGINTRGKVQSTLVVGSDFYVALLGELTRLHPKDPGFKRVKGKPTYPKWTLPQGLGRLVQGLDTSNAIPWWNAKYIVAICLVGGNHWVTVRIHLLDWKVELYDSLSHHYDPNKKSERDDQIKPITRLMPRLLELSGYWENTTTQIKRDDEMELVKMLISAQFAQVDNHSCGPFCCMYLDRLVANAKAKPRHAGQIDDKYIKKYRWLVGSRIFWLTRP